MSTVLVDHRALAERFAAAMNNRSRAEMAALLTEDFVTEWPQSGERVRGFDNFWATIEHYPRAGGAPMGNDISTLRTQFGRLHHARPLPRWPALVGGDPLSPARRPHRPLHHLFRPGIPGARLARAVCGADGLGGANRLA